MVTINGQRLIKATLLNTTQRVSRYGGIFYYAFFKGEDGRSYRTCLYPNCGNFARWRPFLQKKDIVLEGLRTIGKNLIDADSFPKEILYGP